MEEGIMSQGIEAAKLEKARKEILPFSFQKK